MASQLQQNTPHYDSLPKVEGLKIAIVAATWNSHITDALLNGAIDRLAKAGYNTDEMVQIVRVPGTIELTFAAAQLSRTHAADAIIVIGCVIRGDTPHFDYVCQSVTQGCTILNATQQVPVIFGVLTVENEQQALDRAGGCLGNKGAEAAEAAVIMASLAKN
ncbi:MAG: 6,7-dimethyl-8-ribityllumazine synthase [Muribaculaceae bacterium]|nr:6,7-dimethyl-8-ribityllumazine synthase [Muribaculaceae bacterium]